MGIAIAIGNRIGNGSSGGWTPKSIESKLLYWGKISEITGGTMPNKVGTDHIDIGGSAGTYTFQVPNTAPYIAADTDYIWFKTDASQRTTTEAELVGYDLPRTPVKYDDDTPNLIREIIILKDGEVLTTSELNHVFDYMSLPVEWNNDTNHYGHIKSNRIGQNLWTAESLFPITLNDVSKTLGWFDAGELSTITKDGNDLVTLWIDVNGVTTLGDVGYSPKWYSDGILFAAKSLASGVIAVNQPIFIYMVIKITDATANKFIMSANNWDQLTIKTVSTSVIEVASGTAQQHNFSSGSFKILRVLFNGSSSKAITDAAAPTNWNCGANNGNRICLGAYDVSNSAAVLGMQIKELIIRKVSDSSGDESDIYNYLKNKYSL
jgi:hypothetical protein